MSAAQALTANAVAPSTFLGCHHLELYVGNTRQASHYYQSACGFEPVAHSGLTTGARDDDAIALRQGDIRILLKSALHPDAPSAEYVRRHGEGVYDVALEVLDAQAVFERAVEGGATAIHPPAADEDDFGSVVRATIGTPGPVRHTLVQRNGYSGPFLPGFKPIAGGPPVRPVGLRCVDHVAFSLQPGSLQQWVDFYGGTFGFQQTRAEETVTSHSGMASRVMEDLSGRVKFPLTEPTIGKRKSQIEEYLHFNNGPGAQHAALGSDDVIGSVRALRAAGIKFLRTPGTFYDLLRARVGDIDEDCAALRELSILVDRDPGGYLLQIFTEPLDSRPTFFLEIIQRKGATGFGSGNIRALFEAVEREQALRGNL
jgi:4-hydroxyphenylpyruvate dioxygenase